MIRSPLQSVSAEAIPLSSNMAYGSHTLHRSYSVSSVEGIELRLNDKLKPTVKVTLPLQYKHIDPTTLKKEPDYDFKVEKNFLDWLDGVRRAEVERETQRRQQQLGAEAAEAALQQEETVPEGRAPTSDSAAAGGSIPRNPLVPQVAANLSNEILKPVPHTNSIPKPANTAAFSDSNNWADFEGRALDPFELTELETINDMEELRNVLANSAPLAPTAITQDQVQSSPSPMDSQSEESPCQVDHCDVTMDDTDINSQVNLEPNLNQVSFRPSQIDSLASTEDIPPRYQPREQADIPQPNRTPENSSSPSHLPPLRNDPLVARSPLPPIGPSRENSDASLGSQNSVSMGPMHTDQQRKTPPPSYSMIDPSTVPSSSSSIPLEPPPNYPRDELEANFFSASLSPYTPLPPPPSRLSSTISVEPPDPVYEALGVEEKNFVNTIVSMGFPKSRTARAVKNVGNDDRQVVELLCAVDSLCGQGYQEEKVEVALSLQDNDQEKAKTFLSLWQRFEELGFKSEDIKRELIVHGNNEEKVLDTLTR